METVFPSLVSTFLTVQNIAIVAATTGILVVIRRCLPAIDAHPWWARIQPVAPLAIAGCLVFLPGATAATKWGEKLILGIALGAAAPVLYKFVSQSVLGRDQRINPPPPVQLP